MTDVPIRRLLVTTTDPAITAPARPGRVISSVETGAPLAAADYAPVAAFLAGRRRLWLPLHVSPDGDCLGCSLALAHVLNQQGHDCTVVSADPIPAVYGSRLPDPARDGHDR